jgi:hypothetical protein
MQSHVFQVKSMTFPNPANYYLPTPEQFEAEIATLDERHLAYLNYQVGYFLYTKLTPDMDETFNSARLSAQANEWIDSLNPEQLISLNRWIAERLAWFHLPSTIRAKEAFS